jgi:hypothetical protein
MYLTHLTYKDCNYYPDLNNDRVFLCDNALQVRLENTFGGRGKTDIIIHGEYNSDKISPALLRALETTRSVNDVVLIEPTTELLAKIAPSICKNKEIERIKVGCKDSSADKQLSISGFFPERIVMFDQNAVPERYWINTGFQIEIERLPFPPASPKTQRAVPIADPAPIIMTIDALEEKMRGLVLIDKVALPRESKLAAGIYRAQDSSKYFVFCRSIVGTRPFMNICATKHEPKLIRNASGEIHIGRIQVGPTPADYIDLC